MNYWTGRPATIRLSEAGKQALSDWFSGQYIDVFVQWADDLGLWALYRDEAKDDVAVTVVLIKWSHIETAMLDVVLEDKQQPNVIGFGRFSS